MSIYKKETYIIKLGDGETSINVCMFEDGTFGIEFLSTMYEDRPNIGIDIRFGSEEFNKFSEKIIKIIKESKE